MSVDESQWTHGFDVNWCEQFLLWISQQPVFNSLFFTLDIAFAALADEFRIFINSLTNWLYNQRTCVLISFAGQILLIFTEYKMYDEIAMI
jgi:hypothetical protein